MAKKQLDRSDSPDGLDELDVAESQALAEVVEDADGQAIWTLGAWQTFPQWRCALCVWDTLDGEAAMVAHYLATHAPPPPPAPPQTIVVYDRYGRPV